MNGVEVGVHRPAASAAPEVYELNQPDAQTLWSGHVVLSSNGRFELRYENSIPVTGFGTPPPYRMKFLGRWERADRLRLCADRGGGRDLEPPRELAIEESANALVYTGDVERLVFKLTK